MLSNAPEYYRLIGLIVQSAIKLTCSLLLHLNNLELHETQALKTNFAQEKKYITLSLTFNPGVALTSSRKENDSNRILQSAWTCIFHVSVLECS